MNKYDEVDAAILRKLEFGPAGFSSIFTGTVFRACSRAAENSHRVLDRRLQALKKAGRIRCEKRKWYLVQGG